MSRRVFVRAAIATLAIAVAPIVILARDTRAADPPAATPPANATVTTAGDSVAPAPLIVAGRTVIVFRSSFGTIGTEERRERAARMFASVIAGMRIEPVQVDSTAYGNRIRYGSHPLFTITPGDADTAGGQTLASLTQDVAATTADAVQAGIHERNPGYLAVQTLFALLGTALLILLLGLLVRLDERVARRLSSAGEKRLGKLSARLPGVPGHDQVAHAITVSVHTVSWLISLVLVYLWLTFTLRRFPATAPAGLALRGVLWNGVHGVLVGIAQALPGLVTVLVIGLFTRFASRIVAGLFAAIERGTIRVPWIHPDTAAPTRRIAQAILWLFAFIAAYPFIPGSGTMVFKGASVLLGALLSFGSSGVVSQAMSGFVLMYSRAFKKGEYIQVGEVEGTVTEVGILSTKVVTPRHEEMTLPNSLLVGSVTKNYSRLAQESGLILSTSVTIGYDAPWRQVHAMLLQAAGRTAGLMSEPPPFVLQRALSDFYVEYAVCARIERPERRVLVLSELHANIQDAFNEYGVQILSPHYENDRTIGPAMVPKSKWYTPPARPPAPGPDAGA